MKLSTRLSLTFAVLSLLIVIAIGMAAYYNGRAALEADTRNHLTAMTLLKEAQFNNWIEINQIGLQNIAKRPLIIDYMAVLGTAAPGSEAYQAAYSDIYLNHLTQLTEANLGFEELLVLHPETGQILASSDLDSVGLFRLKKLFFEEGLKGTFVQNPYYDITKRGPVFTIATPIVDAQNRTIGVLAGHLNVDVMEEIMQGGIFESDTVDTFLVRPNNFYVTQSRFAEGDQADRSVYTDALTACLQGESGSQIYQNQRGLGVIGAYRWMPERELCIITEVTQEEAFSPVFQLRDTIFLVSLGIALLAAVVGNYLSASITQPIDDLVTGTEIIGAGNLDYSVATGSNNEIGVLSRAFDHMVENLKAMTASRDELDLEISKRRDVERDLRDRENTLSLALTGVGAGLFDWNVETGRVFWDATTERIHGLAEGDFGGGYEDWRNTVHPEDIDQAEERVDEALRGVAPFNTEFRIIRADNEVRTISAQGIIERDPHGQPLRMIGLHIDVTARKNREKMLHQLSFELKERVKELEALQEIGGYEDDQLPLEEYFKKITDRIPASMARPDLGAASIEFLSTTYGVVEAADLQDKIVEEIVVDGHPAGFLYVGYMSHHLFLPEEAAHVRAIADRIGQYVSKQRLMDKLQTTLEHLEESNEELQKFAYVASHDLQEPLRMVTSYLQLLERRYKGQLDEKADQFIHFAVDGALRMKTLINDLLLYSRVTSKGGAFQETDLNLILQDTLRDLSLLIKESGATVTYDPLPILPADETQMHQLLLNLISNAIKFRGDEPLTVCIGVQETVDAYRLFVKDNGIGIESKYFEKIFVIFQRLHSREAYQGTGIGLAVCKRIVDRHNGDIWVESMPGQGTTFFISLPKRQENQHERHADHHLAG